MPKDGNVNADPAMLSGDEIWRLATNNGGFFNVARGLQNKVDPYGDNWTSLYQGLRDCNIFLENIKYVPDIDETEKSQWIAEVKFLKAYYHFYLVRMYGPIPLMKVNLSIDADVNTVKIMRDPIDSCFSYITKLIDEATPSLPLTIVNPVIDLGHITQPIAMSFKAQVLVYAASPLFNGNIDQANLKNGDGTQLFNQTSSKAKWDSAAVACKRAITTCESAGIALYVYPKKYMQYNLTDTIATQLSIRNSLCLRWNSEIIWANTLSYCSIQDLVYPANLNPLMIGNYACRGELSPSLKIAEMFYTQNGVPINEDKTWDYNGRYNLSTATYRDRLYIRSGYTSSSLNFKREPRFYADLGFDGGIWYGHGKYDDKNDMELFYIQSKWKQPMCLQADRSTVTGYFLKKVTNFENVVSNNVLSENAYPWPIIRLSGLYLLYAEALNESAGPGSEVYNYINLVRQRAGLNSVESSWGNYSTNSTKYTTQNGLRDIIHRERLIELAFEGQRYWDLRRWKEAAEVLNAPIKGWDGYQEFSANYYRPVTLFNQTFTSKDYFWPIKDANISVNNNLVQNLGW